MVIGITGHRPERIEGQQKDIELWLIGQFKNLISCYDNIEVISGMAQGVDQIAAVAALFTGAKVRCYFPYRHKLCNMEQNIVDNAAEVRYEAEKYQPNVYFQRDRRIVDDCDMLITIWDGKPWGGTYYTYKYALTRGKEILIYPWKTKEVDLNIA